MDTNVMRVRLTFTESILGTLPNNKDLMRDFIASKAPDANTIEDEIEAIGADDVIEKGMTVFPRMEDGTPFIYDYQIKGFFKDTCSGLSRLTKKTKNADGKTTKKPCNESGKLTAFKKVIDKLIFPEPREIPIHFEGEIGNCQRPLRAQTAQGERVALANSEEIPKGATIEFNIKYFDSDHEAVIREWLDYGIYSGIGQWRNASHGRFVWDELDEKGNVIGGNNLYSKK